MHISRFQLFNYKSFRDSGALEFKPGINIIVGANNAGKTALLEALSLNFETSPHRSIETVPQPNSTPKPKSVAKVTLIFTKAEIHRLFDDLPANHYVGLSSDRNSYLPTDEALALFQNWMDNPNDVELTVANLTASSVNRDDISIKDLDPAVELTYYDEPGKFIVGYRPQARNIIQRDPIGRFSFSEKTPEIDRHMSQDFFVTLFYHFKNRIYRLQAQRFVGECSVGNNEVLNPRGSNLAEVIHLLESPSKRKLYDRFNHYVSTMFPQFGLVSTRILSQQIRQAPNLEILVWPTKSVESGREDLAFSLSDCGTGTGQVLAILYAILASPQPRPIIIDEPQSYLHPGAVKKLIEILKEFPQHQYFIATHSAEIISAANPSTIVKLWFEDGETKASMMNSQDIKEQRSLLAELGVSLSDVFGADSILWVEGPTEELCFPLVLDKLEPKLLKGTKIISIKNTGDLLGKKARFADVMFDLYKRLSGGNNLYPPAVGFVFDRENLSERDIEDLKRRKPHPIEFIERRMYENYLLHPEAIATVLNREDAKREQPLDRVTVLKWLETNKSKKDFFSKTPTQEELSNPQWVDEKIDAAKLLDVLFTELSSARIEYRKTIHSIMLTEWLLENNPEHLVELAQSLKNILNKGKAAVS
ncbi:MAG: AAA family ATPase [Oscillatoriaceae cyanobacterium Prado104]|jgi:predicted ATPase|nr:AAA family ATPase [Oscillatoriaceae cyanobacterium Prado104]